jgi:HEAT repeat protein
MPYLLKALRDPHMSVRLRALQAIASFNDSDLGKAIVPLLKDPSGGVRANALEALIRLRVKGVDHLILAATEDAKWYIRQRAIRAIEERNLLPGGVSLRGRGRNRDRPVAGTLKRGRRRIK